MQTAKVLPIGTPVIYFNLWTGFETTEFNDQFTSLAAEDIKCLKKSDEIYIDIDPMHPNGKVYGRVKAMVIEVEAIDNGEFRIYYSAGRWKGFKTTKNGICHDIDRAKDEVALATIAARLPLSKELDNRFG